MMQRAILLLMLPLLLVFAGGCHRTPAIAPLDEGAVILAFGDSLTYGTGAEREKSYPAVLQTLLARTVINAGVPGEVSTEGLARLPKLLEGNRPALVILCHGGNDLLHRQSQQQLRENLQSMIELAHGYGSDVLLVGVPNLGLLASPPALYEEIARQYRLPYEGEILHALLSDRSLKADPIHPNAAGYRQMAEAILVLIEKAEGI